MRRRTKETEQELQRFVEALARMVDHEGDDFEELKGKVYALVTLGREFRRLDHENHTLRAQVNSMAFHLMRFPHEETRWREPLVPHPKSPPPYDPKDN